MQQLKKEKVIQLIEPLFPLIIKNIYSGSRTRTYDIMINSHALLPTELCRNQVHIYDSNFFKIMQHFFCNFFIFLQKSLP